MQAGVNISSLLCYTTRMKKVVAQKGFTVIEVVIALAVVAVIFTIFQASLTTILLNRRAQNQELAVRVANTKMEAIRLLTFETLPTSTTFTDPLLNSLPQGQATIVTSSYNSKTTEVTVNVYWAEFNGMVTHTVSFTTLVTKGGI